MVRIRKLAARDYKAVKRIERIIVDEYLGYLKEQERRTRLSHGLLQNTSITTSEPKLATLQR